MKYLILLFCTSLVAYNPQQVQSILNAVKSKTFVNGSSCDFRGTGSAFKGLNFSGAQFSGALFSKVDAAVSAKPNLIEISGQNCDLSGCDFSQAELVSVNFAGANLSNANFYGADIAYACFDGADLTGAKLDRAINSEFALFCGATMPDGTQPSGSTWTSKKGKVFYMRCAS